MENKEIYKKLANQIYELDEKVYKASGSNLGKTFTGEKVRTIENLTMLITSNKSRTKVQLTNIYKITIV